MPETYEKIGLKAGMTGKRWIFYWSSDLFSGEDWVRDWMNDLA